MNINKLTELAHQSSAGKVSQEGGLYPPSTYYHFFELLAREMKPKLSVVVGVSGGGDCFHLCKGHPEGKVVGVDYTWDHPDQINHIKKTFKNFHFILNDAIQAAPDIALIHGSIDIFFLDTTHTYENTISTFNCYEPFLSKGAVVCLDDLFRPGMDRAWDEMPEPKVRLDFLHPGMKISETMGDGGWGCLII